MRVLKPPGPPPEVEAAEATPSVPSEDPRDPSPPRPPPAWSLRREDLGLKGRRGVSTGLPRALKARLVTRLKLPRLKVPAAIATDGMMSPLAPALSERAPENIWMQLRCQG